MQILQRDVAVRDRGFTDRKNESYLLAIDHKTGNTLWRHIRPSEAVAESREAFTSPVPFLANGRPELLVVGGDDLTGHDPETGAELWRWGTWNPGRIESWRLVPSPVASENVILVCAPKRDPIYAVKAGGQGQLTDDALAWVSHEQKDVSSDVPTPALYDGDFFILSDVRKRLSRVEPETGVVKWTMRTPGDAKYEASPLVADGKIYLINFVAEVAVVDASDGKLIDVIKMDEPSDDAVRSSIIAAQGQLFIRTTRKLFCIGT
jgi:outer membrane protein assembly factor BamB